MNKEILQIIMAGIGTLGFSIYFRVSEKNVDASTVGGAVGFAFYLLIFNSGNHSSFARRCTILYYVRNSKFQQ